MSNKSHRAKALQSLIDAGPSTSAGQLLPPDSLVREKKSHKSKSRSSASSVAGSSKAESLKGSGLKNKGKSVEVEELEKERKGLGEVDEEDEAEKAGDGIGMDVDMDEVYATGKTELPISNKPASMDDDDSEMLIDPTGASPALSPSEIRARQILESDTSKPTPVYPVASSSKGSAAASDPTDVNFVPLPSSKFAPLSAKSATATLLKPESRRVAIPPHRMTPLKREWVNIYGPLVEMMGLMVRMNVGRRSVELKTSKHTPDQGAIQKGADFVKAFALGFDVKDALAILRLEDLYLDSFEIKDVKTLHGDHLSRAIGRIAGQDGKTRFVIENASRTRIVLAESQIHILGSVQNIKIARDAIVSLILGSPPGKVYATLKTIGARLKQRF